MYCQYCGRNNSDNAVYCESCGSRLQNNASDSGSASYAENGGYTDSQKAGEAPAGIRPAGVKPAGVKPPKKKGGKKKWIFIGAGAALVVIAAAIIILIRMFSSGTVYTDDYEAAAEEYVSVSEEITELTQDDEYINSDTAQKAELMQELLLQLANDGLILEDEIYYDEDSQIIWYEYTMGGIGAVMLQEHAEDTEGASDGDGYVTEYTEEGLVGSIKDVVEIDVDGCPYEEEDLSALIIYDLGFDQIKEYLNDAATLYWPSEYLSTYMLEGASVEILRTLFSGYDLIVIREHGIINEDGQICIELSGEASFISRLLYAAEISLVESDQAYIDDIQAERICILHTSSGEYKFCLMPDFFTYYYGDGGLDDAIVWLGCCNGYMDDSLVGAIAGCGAKAVIGPTESVNSYYGTYMQLAFVYMLMYGNTVEDSLDFAKSVWGENDSVYASNYTGSVDETPAEFRIYNGADEVLVTLTSEAEESLEGSGQEETTQEEPTAEVTQDLNELEIYAEVLDMFYYGLSTQWEEYSLDNEYPMSYLWYWSYPIAESTSEAGYAFIDLDGNGVCELLVSIPTEDGNASVIYDLYSYQDGEVIHLAEGGERWEYWLCSDYTIGYRGSGGASTGGYDFSIVFVSDEYEGLFLFESLTYVYPDEGDALWYYSSDGSVATEDDEEITAEEAQAILDSHEQIEFEITLFSEYTPSDQ